MASTATRRVVTGTDATGKSVIVSDDFCEPMSVALMPAARFLNLWGGDALPRMPNSGDQPAPRNWFPGPGGFRLQEITLAPDTVRHRSNLDIGEAVTEMNDKLPGLLSAMDASRPGVHRTDTLDFVYVIDGHCMLEVDNGVTTALGPGDVVIQNGTRHAWRVPYIEPCRLLSISLGIARTREGAP